MEFAWWYKNKVQQAPAYHSLLITIRNYKPKSFTKLALDNSYNLSCDSYHCIYLSTRHSLSEIKQS